MGLKAAVAAPFKSRGRRRLAESEFVVALSLDRDWYTPEQAERLADVATGEGLLEREGDEVVAAFDPDAVRIAEDFSPGEALLTERSAFERVLEDLVAAGADKQEAVAAINRCQSRLGVSVGAAAVVEARREGLEPTAAAERAREELLED